MSWKIPTKRSGPHRLQDLREDSMAVQEETTAAKGAMYDASAHVFRAVVLEMKELSKKKPEATLNKVKVKMINRIFTDIKQCLKDEEDAKYLELLEVDHLPQYSDVVLIMSQYDAALTKFRRRYYGRNADGQEGWLVRDEKRQARPRGDR
jgi:hypothetical protein